ncbi:amidohydrolase [Rhodobacter sp. Har01]|uniref:amidohydrolase n=1 Tax=Rhodobacter sp. Har01 TaxID=2883999 RepID=UPI001D096201|nr:amidohydrolase [Rhodobacter sp. Har01]MCB6178542.1 amidohydrolase [Rhodobacter sp. Har01]
MADLLIHNARIRTMDPARPFAEWCLIRDGRIAALGQGTPPGAAHKIDAGGRLVLPGFQDAHIHLLSGGTDLATAAQLYDVTSESGLLASLAAHARAKAHLPLVLGAGWQPGLFGDHNLTAALLDRVVPDRPVVIYDSSCHNACLNARALALAGIGDATPDPPNGHIVRDTGGRATGMLHEEAIPWAVARLPQLSDDTWLEGLRAGQAHANAHGITGVLDPRITELEAGIYAQAAATGALSLRVAGAALVTEADTPLAAVARLSALRAAHPGPDFHAHSAKFFMDGVFENRTAACLTPYADAPGGNAPCMFGADQTGALFTALDAARFAIHVHVIGDAAARRALDGLAAARAANGPWPAAHQLTHLQLTDRADLGRLASLATANIQPLWARFDPTVPDIALDMIGPARWPDTYAFRRMLDAGADWCLSSDWPVTTLNPFQIIETAVTRQPRRSEGRRAPFQPDQTLTVEECVLGYTLQAARACWRSGFTGLLRPGFSADLIVVSQDIFACAPEAISETQVLLTLFKGRPVHAAAPFGD